MEDSSAEKSTSYTYWVRQTTCDSAPLPVPRKMSVEELSINSQRAHLGSAWNQAGTWEEKNLNAWATSRIKEMMSTLDPVEYSDGSARVTEVKSCSGDATVVTVRNKKRVGFCFDITLNFEGSLLFEEFKALEGTLRVPEAACGELDELQIEVDFTKDDGLPPVEKARLTTELKNFLPRIREKLYIFEQELKQR